jgi:hypothetical protein
MADAARAATQDSHIAGLQEMAAQELDPNTGLPLSPADPTNLQSGMFDPGNVPLGL